MKNRYLEARAYVQIHAGTEAAIDMFVGFVLVCDHIAKLALSTEDNPNPYVINAPLAKLWEAFQEQFS